MKRRGILSISVAVLLIAVLFIFLVTFQVRLNECAVVFTFGKVDRAITRPGLYWKWPYPIQTYTRYDARANIFSGKFDTFNTADAKNLIITLASGWSIQDPVKFHASVSTPAEAEAQLEGIVKSAANAVIARHNFGEFISTDPKKLAFDNIEKDIFESVRATALERYGIEMRFVRITQLGLPEKNTEKVFARMKAERERIAKRYRADGKSEADIVRARAEQQKQDVLSRAEAEATQLRGEGDAAAAESYAIFKENPELAIFLRKLEALRKLKERSTVILDTRTPPFDLLGKEPQIPGSEAKERPADKPKTGGN